ncbi:MAG: lytic transglycosylase [Desulfuromonas sp.]|nr:MAG: lytic transglycosylase [Desulfuromonas sp.]
MFKQTKQGRFSAVTILFSASISFAVTPSAHGEIYKYVDANGVIHFTDTPTTSAYRPYRNTTEASLLDIINRCASLFRLEEALIKAVIKVESDFNPKAISTKGAQGMMQLLPETARDMKVFDPFNPAENILGGSRYLRKMLDLFDNDTDLALAAYNAGPTTVRRHGGVPPYKETVNYIRKVKHFLDLYRQGKDTYL